MRASSKSLPHLWGKDRMGGITQSMMKYLFFAKDINACPFLYIMFNKNLSTLI
jgi:hypothetical protein